MGKTSKWLKRILTGKKEKDKGGRTNRPSSTTTPTQNSMSTRISSAITLYSSTSKERKRSSCRRSALASTAAATSTGAIETHTTPQPVVQQHKRVTKSELEKKYVMAITAPTVEATDATAEAAALDIKITALAKRRSRVIEETAAIKIQSVFRSFLARKALFALKGLVKLQALVRGYLVRKQATASLRSMQAFVSVQGKARDTRTWKGGHDTPPVGVWQPVHRKSPQDNYYRQTYNEMDKSPEENAKIVEIDFGEARTTSKAWNNYSNFTQSERIVDNKLTTYYSGQRAHPEQEPRACSGHFGEFSFDTNPQYYSTIFQPGSSRDLSDYSCPEYAESVSSDYSFLPNYMANTESSRAKARSQSAPKQRPDTYEKQPSRRRIVTEGRNISRAPQMQRSSSHVGSASPGYNYPRLVKLDQSTMSLKGSEYGSTSTILTNKNYSRSFIAQGTSPQ